MKLSPAAIYCLSEAINKLHEAARLANEPTSDMILELADCVEAIKDWNNDN